MAIVTRELTPADWPALEQLFGENGACGGCWCMAWRVPKGGKLWQEAKGARAHDAMRGLVTQGLAHGILAFDGATPVGWCSLGPRASGKTRAERAERMQKKGGAGGPRQMSAAEGTPIAAGSTPMLAPWSAATPGS